MKYNFDEVIDRSNTLSIKHDFKEEYHVPEGVLPMWVADMDFRPPAEVKEELQKALDHGIYGYSNAKEDYFEALKTWYGTHYGWQLEKEWLIKSPSVVFALFQAVRAFTEEGESVMIQRPVYGPFTRAIRYNNRKLVTTELLLRNGHYEMDYEDMEKKITEEKVKLFILCNPHNPGGRVWTKAELEKTAEICMRHDVIVIADEIHQDFVFDGNTFTCFSTLGKEIERRTITCTSPSKTFNIAGLQIANIFIPNEELREKFTETMKETGYEEPNLMGILAAKAAYTYGDEWVSQLKEYLWGNITYVKQFLEEKLPKIKLMKPEGTYLMWLDFSAYGLSQEELVRKMNEEALVWMNSGEDFGEEGTGYMRMNIACPRSVVEEALRRIERAFA